MIRFVTKKEFFEIEDSGLMNGVQCPDIWHLKTIQDAVDYSYLKDFNGKQIAEIGGGNSRLLLALDRRNTCYNVEPFEGVEEGPKKNQLPSSIMHLATYLG